MKIEYTESLVNTFIFKMAIKKCGKKKKKVEQLNYSGTRIAPLWSQ